MEFRILGPLEVRDQDGAVALHGGKERALLALLLLNANRTLSIDRIVDELWGEDVPETAPKMVQIYVSRLRRALPPGMLHTRPPGYALAVGPAQLDLDEFERRVAAARQRLAAGDREAADGFAAALALWRGPALAEFTSEPFAGPEGARLEELRLAALEQRLEADLLLGRHAELVGELEALLARHPLREGLRRQHMLALYRSGRQAEALGSYRAFRRELDAELGIEPSPALRELERAVLRHDAGLDPPTPPAVEHRRDGNGGGFDLDVRYARSGDVRIAYQVLGDGPLDLVLVHGWVCSFQPAWENPKLAAFYRRLASIGRLILFDKRGTGLSDRVPSDGPADLETRMDDVRAVLDAAGSRRAAVLGISEGGPMSVLFAATYPERTAALVLMGTFARMMWAPDYPHGLSEEEHARRLHAIDADDWAAAVTDEWLARVAPDVLRDPAARRWYVSYVVRGASPAANKAIRLMNGQIDVRHVLPAIGVPTLVLYRADEYFSAGTRYMGEHIPGARVVELPGRDHLPWEGDADALIDEIERFLRGLGEEGEVDRVLATLLFTDVAARGDTAEGPGREELRAAHERVVRSQLARFRGREAGRAGETLFATFDGPARAVRCGAAIVDACRELGLPGRAGVHTGEVEQTEGSVRGAAVDAGARLVAAGRPGEVLVSSTVKDIVAGSGLRFEASADGEARAAAWRLRGSPPERRSSKRLGEEVACSGCDVPAPGVVWMRPHLLNAPPDPMGRRGAC